MLAASLPKSEPKRSSRRPVHGDTACRVQFAGVAFVLKALFVSERPRRTKCYVHEALRKNNKKQRYALRVQRYALMIAFPYVAYILAESPLNRRKNVKYSISNRTKGYHFSTFFGASRTGRPAGPENACKSTNYWWFMQRWATNSKKSMSNFPTS